MYATIHSAEITHRQRANELARNAEFARIRAERPQDAVPATGRLATVLAALRIRRTVVPAPAQ